MSPKQRQSLLLAALLVVLAFVSWRYLKPALAGLADVAGAGVFERGSRLSVTEEEIVALRLADLEVAVRDYQPGRNIFLMGEKPKPPPPPPPPPRPRPRPTTPVAAATPPAPRPPEVDVSLIGIIGPRHRRVAVLRDDNGESVVIFNALEQDVVKKKFIVHRIGYESVDFKFVGFPDVEPERLEIGD